MLSLYRRSLSGRPLHGRGLGEPGRNGGSGGTSGPAAETQIVIFLHQSNMAGGQTTATGAALASPADDAQAGLQQWSPNGGGPYTGAGVESFPANARVLLPASGGGMLNPQTIDANRVGPQYSFLKAAAAANPGLPFVGIPMGVGGTSTVEYTIASSVPSNWPGNRYSVLQTAYNSLKAAVPNSRIYAFVASILENEIQNVDSIVTLPGILDQWITDMRALGGAGASTAPFILSSPIIEWLVYTPSRLAYLLEGAKAAVRNSNVGLIRRQRGYSVPADVIHMTGAGNRIHGPEMHAHRAVAIAQTTTPSSPPSLSMTGERLAIVSTGNPYYEVWYRAPAGSGSYTKTDFVPLENSGVGQTVSCVAPGQGGRDLIVIGKANAGPSAANPTSGTAAMITYAVPAVTPPTPVVSLDIDNASLDGSLNIISIPSNGSDTTAWTPTSAAGQGATAALKRVLVGSKYGLVLDSTSKCVWRGSSYVFPSGDISVVMPMLFSNSGITGTFVGCGQSGTTMDIFFTMANASLNVRGGFTSSSVQVISVSNFLNFQNTTAFYRFFAWTYRRTGNVLTVYMDDDIVLSGTPTQRAASPANSGGTRFYNSGLDTATVGWGGSTVALPPKAYNAELSFNELMKIKNDYRVDHGVNFGYAPS